MDSSQIRTMIIPSPCLGARVLARDIVYVSWRHTSIHRSFFCSEVRFAIIYANYSIQYMFVVLIIIVMCSIAAAEPRD